MDDLKRYTESVVNHVLTATPGQLDAGRNWYRLAGEFAFSLALMHNTTIAKASAVIAVLSPQKSWPVNQKLANLAFAMHANGEDVRGSSLHTGDNTRKLHDVLHLESRDINDYLPLLGKVALKVKAFAQNIRDAARPYNPSRLRLERLDLDEAVREAQALTVTLDRHAIRVCDPTLGKDYKPSKDEHRLMRMAYVEAAIILDRDLGLSLHPWQIQAIAWVVTRGDNLDDSDS